MIHRLPRTRLRTSKFTWIKSLNKTANSDLTRSHPHSKKSLLLALLLSQFLHLSLKRSHRTPSPRISHGKPPTGRPPGTRLTHTLAVRHLARKAIKTSMMFSSTMRQSKALSSKNRRIPLKMMLFASLSNNC